MDKWLKDNAEKHQNKQKITELNKGPKRSITDIKIFTKNGDVENLDYIKELVDIIY